MHVRATTGSLRKKYLQERRFEKQPKLDSRGRDGTTATQHAEDYKINGESVVLINVLGRRSKNQFVWWVKLLPHVRPTKRPENQHDSREVNLPIGDDHVENGVDAPTNPQHPAVRYKFGPLLHLATLHEVPLGRSGCLQLLFRHAPLTHYIGRLWQF